jgi:hypothetical protein
MAEDGTADPGLPSAPTIEPAPIALDPSRAAASRKSTLEQSMFNVNVMGTSTASSMGYGTHKEVRRNVDFDEYFVSSCSPKSPRARRLKFQISGWAT